jgi:hypothetical protein
MTLLPTAVAFAEEAAEAAAAAPVIDSGDTAWCSPLLPSY